MAEKIMKYVLFAFIFTVMNCYFGSQVVCDQVGSADRSKRDVFELYDAPQNVKVFKYLEEPESFEVRGTRSAIEYSDGDKNGSEIPVFPSSVYPAPKVCRDLQTKLAENVASFIQCAIMNARPITVCLKCVTSYNSTVYFYNRLVEAFENDIKCKDVFLGKDKLEIVETMYGNVINMWNQGNCNSCYATDESGSPNLFVVSNQTLNFMQVLKKVMDCIEGIKLLGTSNDTCTQCKLLYEHLGSIFDHISNDMVNNQTGVVCVDITDAMNVTHHIWNNQLKCKLFGTGVGYALIILTACLSAVPVLFYVAAKVLSNVETIHLVLPKRKQFVQESTRFQM